RHVACQETTARKLRYVPDGDPTISNRAIPTATPTFKDSTPGAIRMETEKSHVRRKNVRRPSPSPPATSAGLVVGGNARRSVPPLGTRPTNQNPASFRASIARTRFVTRAIGNPKAPPADAATTTEVTPTLPSRGS